MSKLQTFITKLFRQSNFSISFFIIKMNLKKSKLMLIMVKKTRNKLQ